MAGIIALAIFIFIIFAIKKYDIPISLINNHKIISIMVVVFIALLVLAYLNRYSIVAFMLFQEIGYPFWGSIQKSLSMNNDISFFIGVLKEILASPKYEIPHDLQNAIKDILSKYQESVNGTYGNLGTFEDLYSIIKLVG
jgi:hypothetical protein